MLETQKLEILQSALKDAENELRAARQVLVEEDLQIETLDLTLEVVRIALYECDGTGNSIDGFDAARARLEARIQAIKAEEVKRQIQAIRLERILSRSGLASERLMRAKSKKEKLVARYWAALWLGEVMRNL